jgi:hypothetical protein
MQIYISQVWRFKRWLLPCMGRVTECMSLRCRCRSPISPPWLYNDARRRRYGGKGRQRCQGIAIRCNEMKNVFLAANGAADDGRRVARLAEARLAPFSLFQKPRLLLRALRSVQAPRSPKIVLHQCYGSRTRNGEQMTGRGEKRVNKPIAAWI